MSCRCARSCTRWDTAWASGKPARCCSDMGNTVSLAYAAVRAHFPGFTANTSSTFCRTHELRDMQSILSHSVAKRMAEVTHQVLWAVRGFPCANNPPEPLSAQETRDNSYHNLASDHVCLSARYLRCLMRWPMSREMRSSWQPLETSLALKAKRMSAEVTPMVTSLIRNVAGLERHTMS